MALNCQVAGTNHSLRNTRSPTQIWPHFNKRKTEMYRREKSSYPGHIHHGMLSIIFLFTSQSSPEARFKASSLSTSTEGPSSTDSGTPPFVFFWEGWSTAASKAPFPFLFLSPSVTSAAYSKGAQDERPEILAPAKISMSKTFLRHCGGGARPTERLPRATLSFANVALSSLDIIISSPGKQRGQIQGS